MSKRTTCRKCKGKLDYKQSYNIVLCPKCGWTPTDQDKYEHVKKGQGR